jgi:hypothetical protein
MYHTLNHPSEPDIYFQMLVTDYDLATEVYMCLKAPRSAVQYFTEATVEAAMHIIKENRVRALEQHVLDRQPVGTIIDMEV